MKGVSKKFVSTLYKKYFIFHPFLYEYVIVLRAVVTLDFMTANVFSFKQEFLNHVSTRIMNEIDKVSRVVYDISSKPPATIEWE